MTGQSSDEKFRLTYEACQKIYIHDLLEILVGHVFCCKCHFSPEWRVGRLSAGCRWMRCFLAGQSCSADRGQRIYTHITAHNSPIRKNTRFTWKIPTLRGSPSLLFHQVNIGNSTRGGNKPRSFRPRPGLPDHLPQRPGLGLPPGTQPRSLARRVRGVVGIFRLVRVAVFVGVNATTLGSPLKKWA